MKRRLQLYLERTHGSAYGTDSNTNNVTTTTNNNSNDGQLSEAPPVPKGSLSGSVNLAVSNELKAKKGRAVKMKQKLQPPPDGGRFDIRYLYWCRAMIRSRFNILVRSA